MRPKPEKKYATEAALCADFMEWVKPQGWIPYAETAGWDILLVRLADGEQIGIQAKLRFNLKLLTQTIPTQWESIGPDRRAILLPERSGADSLLDSLGIGEFYRHDNGSWYDIRARAYRVGLKGPKLVPDLTHCAEFHWNPEKRCPLPAYVPDVAAGASCPVQLTEWKIAALRCIAVLEQKGSISRREIKEQGCDPRRWIAPGGQWLLPADEAGRYIRGPRLNFDLQHPKVYAEIKAAMAKQK